jgi:hypothetical protein
MKNEELKVSNAEGKVTTVGSRSFLAQFLTHLTR